MPHHGNSSLVSDSTLLFSCHHIPHVTEAFDTIGHALLLGTVIGTWYPFPFLMSSCSIEVEIKLLFSRLVFGGWDSLGQWFSNFSMLQSDLEVFFKNRLLDLPPEFLVWPGTKNLYFYQVSR